MVTCEYPVPETMACLFPPDRHSFALRKRGEKGDKQTGDGCVGYITDHMRQRFDDIPTYCASYHLRPWCFVSLLSMSSGRQLLA